MAQKQRKSRKANRDPNAINRRKRLAYWGLAVVKRGQERFARLNLEQRKVDVFLPRVRETYSPKLTPMFPGYLFIKIVDGQWSHIRYCPGILYVVANHERAARVADREIKRILSECKKHGYVDLYEEPEPLKEGQHVEIKHGLFKGQFGRYKGKTADERNRVLLSMFGKEAEIEVGRRGLQAVGAKTPPTAEAS